MGPATRAKALEKIHQFTPKIGYPSKWRDYTALQVSPDDPVGNAQRAGMFEWNRDVSPHQQAGRQERMGHDAVHHQRLLQSLLQRDRFPGRHPAGAFLRSDADDAVNYGAIGAVIGHEISHGFDDQGSKYDGKGVFQDWWTKEDRANFDARTAAW
jgi:putative endopeptidase